MTCPYLIITTGKKRKYKRIILPLAITTEWCQKLITKWGVPVLCGGKIKLTIDTDHGCNCCGSGSWLELTYRCDKCKTIIPDYSTPKLPDTALIEDIVNDFIERLA